MRFESIAHICPLFLRFFFIEFLDNQKEERSHQEQTDYCEGKTTNQITKHNSNIHHNLSLKNVLPKKKKEIKTNEKS